jgi:endoglucanase
LTGKLLTIIIITFQINPCLSQVAHRPFPQHTAYQPGTIKPNRLTQQETDTQVLDFYKGWKKQYIHPAAEANQEYVFFEEEGSKLKCVSEGQGYGMIIVALMAGADPLAQTTFNHLFNYVRAHPSNAGTVLMAWSQLRNNKNRVATSATDGDLDIAYALLLADTQWGSDGEYNYFEAGCNMINAIMQEEINRDSYSMLISDAVKPDSKDYFDTRSSDFMPLHCKSFERATGDLQWKKVVDRNYTLFSYMQESFSQDAGLIPDFIIDINRHAKPAKPGYLESRYDGCYNYNACRIPLRIATDYLFTGDIRSREMIRKINRWIRETTSGKPDNISAGYRLTGDDIKTRKFEALSFIGPFAVAAMIDDSNQQWLNDIWDYLTAFRLQDFDYYDNSIKMLCMLVASGNYWIPENNKGAN